MSAQTATVTDAQRIAYAVKRVAGWAENYRTNAAHALERGNAREEARLLTWANTMQDIVAMLDGSDDSYIAQLLKAGE